MYFFARIKPVEAMTYLSLKRDSFNEWCHIVNLKSYQYEMSNRVYFESGEFYAVADKRKIERLKDLHGDNWHKFYKHYEEVLPYLSEEIDVPKTNNRYEPKSSDVVNFINDLSK